jgi:flagellar biosynthesis anti-sigma factor FlgM
VTTIQNGGNDPQRMRDINGAGRTSRPVRPQGPGAGSAPGTPSGPALQVSAQGERFVSLRSRLDGLDASRAERVERLRQRVAAGQYVPDSDATAAAMLKDPATAAALGMRTTSET